MSTEKRGENQPQETQERQEKNGMSRRDLFKNIGIIGTGATLAATVGTSNKALASQNISVDRRNKWYVKTVDKITTPYDLSQTKRFDERNYSVRGPGYASYAGEEKDEERGRKADEKLDKGIREEMPGWTLWDDALVRSTPSVPDSTSWFPISATSPEERGYAPYEQPPEVAAKHVKHAARYFGASTVGITALRKEWTYSVSGGGDVIDFEDVDEPIVEEGRRVIPEKCKNIIIITAPQSLDNIHYHQTRLGGGLSSYSLGSWTRTALAEFIRWLGFIAIPCSNNTFVTIPHAIEAGLGELGRHNRMVCPDYGMNSRLFPIATDMPLAHDKPIDFGLIDFCKDCMKCAELCPAGAISFEREPTWDVKGPWNNPGHKAWFEDAVACRWYMSVDNCANCQGTCPYTKKGETVMHDFVKGTAARTRMFNKAFVTFDDMFGYGFRKDPKKWWDLDLPMFGLYEL